AHGSTDLPAGRVDCYNVELRDRRGFLRDRATKGAVRKILEHWRKPLRKGGKDTFGEEAREELGKEALGCAAESADPQAAGVLQGASRISPRRWLASSGACSS